MREAARIIDANANRAREALRVLEDAARFALGDAALSERAKHLRHDLVAALAAIAAESGHPGLAARDTPHDVGTTITTAGERRRDSLHAVAAAAAARAAEALRSIEEFSKALPADASQIEALRYRLYDLHQALLLRLAAPAPQWTLCVLITESLCTHHPWERVAELALAAGADCLQLREKDLDDAELLRRARHLVALAKGVRPGAKTCPGATAWSSQAVSSPPPIPPSIIINDRPDIALLAHADGVHLGQTDLPPDQARRILGERAHIGVSASSAAQATAALCAGASYVGLGPMFPTTTKHKPTIAGPDLVRDFVRTTQSAAGSSDATPDAAAPATTHAPTPALPGATAWPSQAVLPPSPATPAAPSTPRPLGDSVTSPPPPHLAIGGITPDNAHLVFAAGARGVAVSSAVCSARHPGEICAMLIAIARRTHPATHTQPSARPRETNP